MIDIMIADDFPLVREGVKEILLQSLLNVSVVAEAGNPEEVMQQLSRIVRPDLLILDISMPGNSGLQTLKTVKRRYPKLAVLMLSIHDEEYFAPRALQEGASGYLLKSSVPEELVEAVTQIVLKRKKYVSSKVTRILTQKLDTSGKSPLTHILSNTECKVACMLAAGRNIVSVAKELEIGIPAARSYRAAIMKKMGLRNVADLAGGIL